MTQPNAVAWLHLYSDLPDDLRPACKHGHAECSTTPGGECLDEVIKAAIPQEA